MDQHSPHSSFPHTIPASPHTRNVPNNNNTHCSHTHLAPLLPYNTLTCLACHQTLKQRSNPPNPPPSRIPPSPPKTAESGRTTSTDASDNTTFATLARRPSSSIYSSSAVSLPSRVETDRQHDRQRRSNSPVSPLLPPPPPLFSGPSSPSSPASPKFTNQQSGPSSPTSPLFTNPFHQDYTTFSAFSATSSEEDIHSARVINLPPLPPTPPREKKLLKRLKGKFNKMLQYPQDVRKVSIGRHELVASDSEGFYGGYGYGGGVPERPETRPGPLYGSCAAEAAQVYHQPYNTDYFAPSTARAATSYAPTYPLPPPEEKIAVLSDNSFPVVTTPLYRQPDLSAYFNLFLSLSSIPLGTPQGRSLYLHNLELFRQQTYHGRPGYKVDLGYFINGQKIEVLVGGVMSRVFFEAPGDAAVEGEGGVFRTVTVTECLRDFSLDSPHLDRCSSSSSGSGSSGRRERERKLSTPATPTKRHRFFSFSSADTSERHSGRRASTTPMTPDKKRHTHPHPLTLHLAALGPVLGSPYEAFIHAGTGHVYFISDLPRGYRRPEDHVGRVERKCWRSSRGLEFFGEEEEFYFWEEGE
ncbi:hypothetical protein BJ508DRAFT_315204 [Ascobolus immersus RN42]|uniref:Uncharacterized protein n=1 Tax=Ascobolus immersus RN42 TaxID=1160509 RepID=A0A3N4HFH7_ASCIM|nr:hypothetical protein BJ508DRAFT_315204 [Ascobolus immersus RN42]